MNLNKLRGVMAEKRISGSDMAKILCITSCAFSRKLNGKSQFTAEEINKMRKVIPDLPVMDIFFADAVTETRHNCFYPRIDFNEHQ